MAPKTPHRRRTQAPHRRRSSPRDGPAAAGDPESIVCERCGDGDFAADLVLCDKCDRGFHLFCLRPILAVVPHGSLFCPSCTSLKPKQFPLIQTKIVDFIRIQRSPALDKASFCQKRKRRSAGLAMGKKKRKLLPFNPSDDPESRMKQMASLATALTTTGTLFRNELTYLPGMASRSANRADLERGGMQVLSREDTETLNQCRKMMEMGEWPPLLVVFDEREGFTVQADKFIKDLTIVSEYVGDVDYLEKREHDDGDSMMTLISADDPALSLVVFPDKRSNIARFISGINNHSPEGKKKQNLKCVRYDVGGECRVLLVANRDIRMGERLYYDYNGYEHEYPTHHFV